MLSHLLKFFRDPNQDIKFKASIAKDLVARQIPNITDEQGNVAVTTIIQYIKDSNEPQKISESSIRNNLIEENN